MSDAIINVPSSGRSWREINQDVTPRAMSRQGRFRQRLAWFKIALGVAFALGLAYAAWSGVNLWRHDRTTLAAATGSEPVRAQVLITDGVLDKKWLEETLALPKDATLMSLDLVALREKLAVCGQVRLAVVSRSFPDTLVVNVHERLPVARVQVRDGFEARQLFVARDGTVYAGSNYQRSLVASLPWLDGIKLVRTAKGFAPVDGMTDVADLLATAQTQAPQLYHTWLIVSLARLGERDEIVVKSQDIPEIVFSRREDFFKQIAQLDYVTDMAQKTPEAALQTVNLALGDQVPVQVLRAADAISPRENTPAFTLHSKPRKGNRDF